MRTASLLFSLTIALAAGRADAACHLGRIAELPVAMQGPRAIVPARINGEDVRMVLDTGAWFSMLTPAAAARLKLTDVTNPRVRQQGVGGLADARVGTAGEFVFAGVTVKDMPFIIGGPGLAMGGVGLLGQNAALGRSDVEYDLANGALRLFKATGCKDDDLAYWTEAKAGVVRLDPVDDVNDQIVVQVKINGQAMTAVLDTGAPDSVITLAAAQRAGIRIDGAGVIASGVGAGLGPRQVETWIAPVADFRIGDEQISNGRLRVARMNLPKGDLLLGADFFLSHRILVGNSVRRLYFTYNGGAVFGLAPGAAGLPDHPRP